MQVFVHTWSFNDDDPTPCVAKATPAPAGAEGWDVELDDGRCRRIMPSEGRLCPEGWRPEPGYPCTVDGGTGKVNLLGPNRVNWRAIQPVVDYAMEDLADLTTARGPSNCKIPPRGWYVVDGRWSKVPVGAVCEILAGPFEGEVGRLRPARGGFWDDVKAGLLAGVVESLPAGGGLAVAGLALVAGKPEVAREVVRKQVASVVRAVAAPTVKRLALPEAVD